MQVFEQIEDLSEVLGPLHLAIGVFDGLHCGHQAVVRAAQQACESDSQGGSVVVVTFDPHPARVINPRSAPRLLTSQEHKLALMSSYGIERVLVIRFDETFRALSGREFVNRLDAACRPLHTICVGSDWSFGHRRSGDVDLLREMGTELGFSVIGVPTVKVDSMTASSTAIREAVERGDFQLVAAMLGRPYTVLGTVVEGRKLGRKIGFPTANLKVHNEQLPPSGVYAVTAIDRSSNNPQEVPGVANLGKRPTVEQHGAARRRLEVHLFDFEGDLYDRDLEVRFVRFLRGEKKFSGVGELTKQIAEDAEQARRAILRLQSP